MVKIAESLDFKLISRTQTEIIIENPLKENESFEILHIFPFTSESKKMGIIIKPKKDERIFFYLKGADVVMKNKVFNKF